MKRVIELVINEDEESGVNAISLVDNPAIEINFLYFKKEDIPKNKFLFADTDKHILVSPIMIPNIEIPRLDDNNEVYYVKFSEETILKIAQKFMKDEHTNETNIDHQANIDAGTYLFESWIVETPEDKAYTKYNFNIPLGTWMGSFKVDDDDVWELVKSGKVNGVSVEGLFIDADEIEAKSIYNKIRNILLDDNYCADTF